MEHSHVPWHRYRDSFMHRLDPRSKLIVAFLFILAVNLTPLIWQSYAVYLVCLLAMTSAARLPVLDLIKRSWCVLPFVLMVTIFVPFTKPGTVVYTLWNLSISREGLEVMAAVLVRSWLSLLCLVILSATTSLDDLLLAMRQLRLPRILVTILSFMYRYLFLLAEEAGRMKQARDARSSGVGRIRQWRTLGHLVGTLFIRSYERGERVYAAMLGRGYDGQYRSLHRLSFKTADRLFVLGSGTLLALVLVITFYSR